MSNMVNLCLVFLGFSFCFFPLITLNKCETFQEGGDLEKQKLRQKLKAREWDELMSSKKKMKVLEPVVRGCVWEGDGDGLESFQCYAVCLFEPLPKTDTSPSPEELSQRVQREDHCKYFITPRDLCPCALLWVSLPLVGVKISVVALFGGPYEEQQTLR